MSLSANTSKELRQDRDFVLAAVQQNGYSLRFASEELRQDRGIVLAAVEQDGLALTWASDDLKNDRDVVLAAVKNDGNALNHASGDLRNDREVVLATVQNNGLSLRFASAELFNDRHIVLTAVQNDATSFQLASDGLKNDRELVLAAVQRDEYGEALQYASAELRQDRGIVLAAVQRDEYGEALQYASAELKNDRGIVLAAVQQNGLALKYASEELKNGRELVLAAVTSNGRALQYASEELKNDRDIVLAAIQQDGEALQYVSAELRQDRGIVLAAVQQNGLALESAPANAIQDRELVLAAVTSNGLALGYAPEELKKDREFVLAAVTSNGRALQYASEEFRKDRELVLAAVTSNGWALEYASEEFKKDRELVLAAVTSNGRALQYASEEFKKDRELVLAAVTSNGLALGYAPEELKKDREFVLAAVTSNGRALQYASEEFKKDRELVLAAVTSYGWALPFASEELKNDRELKLIATQQIHGQEEKSIKSKTTLRGQKIFGDKAQGEDLLGVRHVTRALAETICFLDLDPPLVVAILGKWGSGKSYNFNLIRQEIGRIQSVDVSDVESESPYVGHIYPIVFNVWHYHKADLWASLMLTLLTGLNEQLQYEKLIEKDVLRKGVDLVKLMEKTTEPELKRSLEGKNINVENWKKVDASRITDSLIDAVTSSRKEDKDNLAAKRKELRKLKAESEQLQAKNEKRRLAKHMQNSMEKMNPGDSSGYCFECCFRDKSAKIRALLQSELEKRNAKEDNQNEKTTLLDSPDKLMNDILPEIRKNYRKLFWAGEMSSGDKAFLWAMIILALFLPIVIRRVFDNIDGLYVQLISIFGPIIAGGSNTFFSKINDALHSVRLELEKVESDADQDKRLLEIMELGDVEWQTEQEEEEKKQKAKIDDLQSEISSIEERRWLERGKPLDMIVRDRLETSGYEKKLGVVHRAHLDIKNMSDSMLNNDNELFPRGNPRIVLFVDDLDRCRPDKVLEMVDALQLLAKTDLFVVVAAIDTRYVTLCLEKAYKGVLGHEGGDKPTGLEYLEKIIQISYAVPTCIRKEEYNRYIDHQCPTRKVDVKPVSSNPTETPGIIPDRLPRSEAAKARQRYEEQLLTPAEKEALANVSSVIQVNPRGLKRVVNCYKIIKIVSYRQGFKNVEIAILVLLAMSASTTMRPIMRPIVSRVISDLESGGNEKGNFAELFGEMIKNDKISQDRDGIVKSYLENAKWEDQDGLSRVRDQLSLFRCFAYLGERNTAGSGVRKK